MIHPPTLLNHRLHSHRISGGQFAQPQEAVAWFGAMQAQDFPHSKWAVGLRCVNVTDAEVEQAIADRKIVRTWAMRGTLQLIAAQDVRWMTELVAARLIAGQAASEVKRFELDAAAFKQAERIIAAALRGGAQLTRKEIYDVLERRRISTSGQRGYHILWHAALRELICQGARRGKDETFVLLDDWLPQSKARARDEAVAELARRYFQSHGPATLQDFVWWSGLTVSEARAGLAGAKPWLTQETFGDQTYWLARDAAPTHEPSPTAHLLAGFDEYLLGYTDRNAVIEAAHTARAIHSNGIFKATVVIDGRIVGTWGRTTQRGAMTVTLDLFATRNDGELEAIATAVARFGAYLGQPIKLHNLHQ